MTILFLTIASIFFCGHRVSGVTAQPYEAVLVKNCSDEFVPLYQDKGLTTAIANPAYSDDQGNFSFYVVDKCVRVSTSEYTR